MSPTTTTKPTLRRIASILIAMAIYGAIANAQSGVGISPPRVEHYTAPGQSVSQTVAIDNPSGSSALEVSISVSDALFQPDGSMMYLPPRSHASSAAQWLSLSDLDFVLAPSEVHEINYTLDVPSDAPAGTYWTAIFFESQAPGQGGDQDGIGVETRVRVGHIVYVHVGEVIRSGEIQGFRYQEPTDEPSSVRVSFNNTGNGLVRVEGHVELRSESGELVETANIVDTATFPGYTREVPAYLSEPLQPGRYLTLAVLDYGGTQVIAGEGWIEVP